MTTDKEPLQIRVMPESMKIIREISDRFGWTTGQTVSELCLFYKRIQEEMAQFWIARDSNGVEYVCKRDEDGKWEPVHCDCDELGRVVFELQKEVRNAFRTFGE